MTQYFFQDDLIKVKKQRNTLLWIFISVLIFYALATAGFITWFALLPYNSPTQLTIKIIHYVLTGLVIIFLFIFMGIPYKRANKAYKFCKNLDTGVRETSEASFFEYDDALQEKDGVDCKSLIFLEWNKYKKDYFERKVLVFYEKPFPEIPLSSMVRFVTQGNFLIEYEIMEEEPKKEKKASKSKTVKTTKKTTKKSTSTTKKTTTAKKTAVKKTAKTAKQETTAEISLTETINEKQTDEKE